MNSVTNINVSTGSKIKECVDKALSILRSDGEQVTIRAKDKAISKAISITEIVKRLMGGETNVRQTTTIAYFKKDSYNASDATKSKIPTIEISLISFQNTAKP
ncbi:hypothetical protein HK100_000257 [Physocladia obscura]|uniref:DNA/RNA-binding protein Alba-like domain-containing protein n=1 Tax=Physocladia obscura TaxID=109957 RepID=A0AAD5XFQ8_9FUNG|nr:hypothetical protein HK100_000257 [Physocladia obscura]